MDILIIGGTVVTQDPERRMIDDGAVAITGNKIIEVGKARDLKNEKAEFVINAKHNLILPGFVDAHTHSQSTISSLRGYGFEAPGGGLYKRLMTIRVKVSDKERYYLSMGGNLTSLRFGTTTVADWDFGESMSAKTIQVLGLRGLLSEYIYGIDFHETRDAGVHVFSPEEADRTMKVGIKLVEDWHGKADGRIRCSLGPHAPDTCPPELLKRIKDEAEKRGLRINTHLAQSKAEIQSVKEQHNRTSTEYLRDQGILGPNTTVAHCTNISDSGIKTLSETQTRISICPRIYVRRGGSTPVMKFLTRGCRVGLGTDGAPDMIRFMESTLINAGIRKTYHGDGSSLRSQDVLDLATIEAAKVIGMDDEIGSLEPGKKADVIMVDMKKPHMIPNVDPVANLVYYGSGNDVKTVIIDGKVIMEDRVMKNVDEFKILQKTQRAAENVWKRYYDD
jgi:5-methylthioadenosine/S-adenosylhomocysteine deaminase